MAWPGSNSGTQDSPLVKVAVQYGECDAFMGEYNSSKSLEGFIQELCMHWKLNDSKQYMLHYSEWPHQYVCEGNKHVIKRGTLMKLVVSAPLVCRDILSSLKQPQQQHDRATLQADAEHLIKLARDPTPARCIVEHQGLESVMTLVLSAGMDEPLLQLLLHAFTELMNNAHVDWDVCDEKFINKVVLCIETKVVVGPELLLRSLVVAEKVVVHSRVNQTIVERSITLLRLMQHLNTNKERAVQRAVLALVTALMQNATPQRRRHYATLLSDRAHRSCITDNLLTGGMEEGGVGRDVEVGQQLHKLQQLLLNELEARLLTGVAADDAVATERILTLRNKPFEDQEAGGVGGKDVGARRLEIKKEYKKFGFKNENPAQDFNEVPPGVLALDNMYYFCQNRTDQYSKLVLENYYRADSHECPIGKASIELTKLLAEILKVGEEPKSDCADFHPMLFTNDHPFEELFCICINLLNKTWKEMKATTDDFSKVLRVVKEQVVRGLLHQPANLDQFQKRLNELPYSKIAEYWHQERLSTEEKEMQAPQIQVLREEVRRDIVAVVQQQRLRLLEVGAKFRNTREKRGRDKYFFCRLSANHKLFHYDDCDEKTTKIPALDDLAKKISVSEIKSLATGKHCPHYNTRRKNQYLFSFMLESNKVEAASLDFVAANEDTFNYWQDGIKVLLRENMSSDAAERDVEMLLNMEIKLQLLDVEGVTIPLQPPPVPAPPPNYNFCYNL